MGNRDNFTMEDVKDARIAWHNVAVMINGIPVGNAKVQPFDFAQAAVNSEQGTYDKLATGFYGKFKLNNRLKNELNSFLRKHRSDIMKRFRRVFRKK